MYAIIRTGGKEIRVSEGDVIDVLIRRASIRRAEGEVEFTPLLVVDLKGNVFSGGTALKTAKVRAKVVGTGTGDKIDIFKYKSRTHYRRRASHRLQYIRIEVTDIEPPEEKMRPVPDAGLVNLVESIRAGNPLFIATAGDQAQLESVGSSVVSSLQILADAGDLEFVVGDRN